MTFRSDEVFFTEQEIAEISSLTESSATQYFDIYFRARLRSLSDAEKAFLTMRRQSIIKMGTFEGYLNGACDHRGQVFLYNLPGSFDDSLVEYFLAAHELEHVLQVLRLGDGRQLTRDEYLALQINPEFVFQQEKHAMLAEGFYLRYAPRNMLRAIQGRLHQLPRVAPGIQNGFVWGPLLGEQAYLMLQWQSERYSHEAIKRTIAYKTKCLSGLTDP